jgi:predicted NAD-dependent protein-ADP-ribosyltransferase YbiA (DUF1768 family)
MRWDWHLVKVDVMRKVLILKFSQHDTILRELMETGDACFVEHTEKDHFWGDGGDEYVGAPINGG